MPHRLTVADTGSNTPFVVTQAQDLTRKEIIVSYEITWLISVEKFASAL